MRNDGKNGCMVAAARALRFLADNERPSGGEQNFNSAHLCQLADELDATRGALAIANELGKFIEGFFLENQYREALSFKAAEFVHGFAGAEEPPEPPNPFYIEHDGFMGTIQGRYVTREGKPGVVLQQVGTRVVHVYGEKWLKQESAIDRLRSAAHDLARETNAGPATAQQSADLTRRAT